MPKTLPQAHEWVPESQLRDALLGERLPTALRDKTLFWINIRRYLEHTDSRLPAVDYLKRWQQIYSWRISDDTAELGKLSYVALREPKAGKKIN